MKYFCLFCHDSDAFDYKSKLTAIILNSNEPDKRRFHEPLRKAKARAQAHKIS
jgi:hypothetical protein